MTVFTYGQLEQLWLQAGGAPSEEAIMAAIAEAESSGNSNATGGVGEEGLWQIYPKAWPGWATYDPLGNAKAAVHVLAVQGHTAWSTFNSGEYKKFLQSGVPAASVPPTGLVNNGVSTTGINVPLPPPFNNIPGIQGGSTGSIFDPNTLIQDFGQAILKSFGISSMKDLFQRLGLILLGAVIMFIGISMLTRGAENKIMQSSPGSQASTQSLSPAERESSSGAGVSGASTGGTVGEALEAAAVAL